MDEGHWEVSHWRREVIGWRKGGELFFHSPSFDEAGAIEILHNIDDFVQSKWSVEGAAVKSGYCSLERSRRGQLASKPITLMTIASKMPGMSGERSARVSLTLREVWRGPMCEGVSQSLRCFSNRVWLCPVSAFTLILCRSVADFFEP